ncbi:hypothetical protein [Sphingomicrobium nitratireducens]|uniref:hypothetical protein n=1 Tax=Sphingomicrobium nitratireducens TaxID=2964666 RepID=UPI0022400954|nr:hypothetical protein [Sphingomicrobium nitratireducens]
MNAPWFEKRKYGMGVRPVSAPGWFASIALIGGLVAVQQLLLPQSQSKAIAVGVVLVLCFLSLVIAKTRR